jgi:hypothetical protein
MKAITQKHDFGCGIASVAFVSQVPYEQVVNYLGIEQAKTSGFTCKELVKALEHFGLSYDYKYIKPRLRNSIYSNGVIVFIKRSKRYPYGHYITYYNGQWADSWINLPKDNNLSNAMSGFRKRLPGKPIYMITPR